MSRIDFSKVKNFQGYEYIEDGVCVKETIYFQVTYANLFRWATLDECIEFLNIGDEKEGAITLIKSLFGFPCEVEVLYQNDTTIDVRVEK